MGQIEELEEDQDLCASCQKPAESKCTNCREVFYCARDCQKKHWKQHKFDCQGLLYKIGQSKVLGKFLEAAKDIKKGEIIFKDSPLVIGPVAVTPPVCLHCYKPVDGSFRCRKSGWPLCGPKCEAAVSHNPEVVVPNQTDAKFEIDDFSGAPCYLYECIGPLRTLLMQKTSQKKFKKILSLESHLKLRRGTDDFKKSQENVVEVMKRTLGIMVFEALCPEFNFTDELIHEICGIFETNAIEIRLAQSEVNGIYEIGSLMEHNCVPNICMTFDSNLNLIAKAGRDISKGEHLSIMYTHSLWGTHARRMHLNQTKKFWCQCQRCQDPTEFGTEFSSVFQDGKLLRPKDPLDQDAPWVSNDGSVQMPSHQMNAEMQEVGSDLALLQLKGTIEDYEEFIKKNEKFLNPNHYHMLTAKHSLMQMLGRTEGCLIQDMPMEQLQKKEAICREVIAVCQKLDPAQVRLNIYNAAALYELHLPLLQYGKRKWETGDLATEDFRKTLYEPRDCMKEAMELLENETNDNLPEGQLRIQIKDTLGQLEQFMKTLGCEDI